MGSVRIEYAVGRLKRFRRIALSCEKAKYKFLGIFGLSPDKK
jgi:hypothetical protein